MKTTKRSKRQAKNKGTEVEKSQQCPTAVILFSFFFSFSSDSELLQESSIQKQRLQCVCSIDPEYEKDVRLR